MSQRFENDEAGRAFVGTLTDSLNALKDASSTVISAQEALAISVRAIDAAFAALPVPFDEDTRLKAAAAHASQIALLNAIANDSTPDVVAKSQRETSALIQQFTFAAEPKEIPGDAGVADDNAREAEIAEFFNLLLDPNGARPDIVVAARNGDFTTVFELTQLYYSDASHRRAAAETEADAETEVPTSTPEVPTSTAEVLTSVSPITAVGPLIDIEQPNGKPTNASEKALRDAVLRHMQRVPNMRAQQPDATQFVMAAERLRAHPDTVLSEIKLGAAVVPFSERPLATIPGELLRGLTTFLSSWILRYNYPYLQDYIEARRVQLRVRRADIEKVNTYSLRIEAIKQALDSDIRQASWDNGLLAPQSPDKQLRGVHLAEERKAVLLAQLKDTRGGTANIETRQQAVIRTYLGQLAEEERNLGWRVRILKNEGAQLTGADAIAAAYAEWNERTYESDSEALARIQKLLPGARVSLTANGSNFIVEARNGYIAPAQRNLPRLTARASRIDEEVLAAADDERSLKAPASRVQLDRAIDGNTDLWRVGFRGTLSPSTVQLFFASAAFSSTDRVGRFLLLNDYIQSIGKLNRRSVRGLGDISPDEIVESFADLVDDQLRLVELPPLAVVVRTLREYEFAHLSADAGPDSVESANDIHGVLENVPGPNTSTHKLVLEVIDRIVELFSTEALQQAFRLGYALSIIDTEAQRIATQAIVDVQIAPGAALSDEARDNVAVLLNNAALTLYDEANRKALTNVVVPVAEAIKGIGHSSSSLVGSSTVEIVHRMPGKLFGFPSDSIVEVEYQPPTNAEQDEEIQRILARSQIRQLHTLTRIETEPEVSSDSGSGMAARSTLVVDEVIRNIKPEQMRALQIANLQTRAQVTLRLQPNDGTTPYIIERTMLDINDSINSNNGQLPAAEPNGALAVSRLHAAVLALVGGKSFIKGVTGLLDQARGPGDLVRSDEASILQLLRSCAVNPVQNVTDLLQLLAKGRDSTYQSQLALAVVISSINYLVTLFGIARVCAWPLLLLFDSYAGIVDGAARLLLRALLGAAQLASANLQWAVIGSMLNTFEQQSRINRRGGAIQRQISLLRHYIETMQAGGKSPLELADGRDSLVDLLRRFALDYGLASVADRAACQTLFASLAETFKTHRMLQACSVALFAALVGGAYSTGALLGCGNIIYGLVTQTFSALATAPLAFFLRFAYGAASRIITRTLVNSVAVGVSAAVERLGAYVVPDPRALAGTVRRAVLLGGMITAGLAPYYFGSEYAVPDGAGFGEQISSLVKRVFTEGTPPPVGIASQALADKILPIYTGRLAGRVFADLVWSRIRAATTAGAPVEQSVDREQELNSDAANAFNVSYLRQKNGTLSATGFELWNTVLEYLVDYDLESDTAHLHSDSLLPESLKLAVNFLLFTTRRDVSLFMRQTVDFGTVRQIRVEFDAAARGGSAERSLEAFYAAFNRSPLRNRFANETPTTHLANATKGDYETWNRVEIDLDASDNPESNELASFISREIDPLSALPGVRIHDLAVRFERNEDLADQSSAFFKGALQYFTVQPDTTNIVELLNGVDVDQLVYELFVLITPGQHSPALATAAGRRRRGAASSGSLTNSRRQHH